MKVKAFLKKSGISQYNLDVANKEEKDILVTMFQLANKEIFDLKKDCRDYYSKINFSDEEIERRISQELNILHRNLAYSLKMNGWFFRLRQWQRIYNEDYTKVLNETAHLDENTKWKRIGDFFNTHEIPNEFRFKFEGIGVKTYK